MYQLRILALLLAMCQAAEGATVRWDLAGDFATSPNQANPNPDPTGNANVWSFLESPTPERDPTGYRLLTEFVPNTFNIPGLEQWQAPDTLLPGNRLPAIGINASGSTQNFLSLTWPSDAIRFHPFENRLAIAGWRSPIDGFVDVAGSFGDMDPNGGNGVRWFVDLGTRALAGGSIDGTSESFDKRGVRVKRGDFLYFAVDPKGGDFFFDSTQVDVAITPSAVPLPAPFSLLALGVAMMGVSGLWARRRLGN
jgi:hypothetical protein